MGIGRKIKRKKLKEQGKKAKKTLKNIVNRMNSLGDTCSNCPRGFDRSDEEDTSKWMVYVIDNQPNLICPDCYKTIQEKTEELRVDGDAEVN